jgi:hypothetical protein
MGKVDVEVNLDPVATVSYRTSGLAHPPVLCMSIHSPSWRMCHEAVLA